MVLKRLEARSGVREMKVSGQFSAPSVFNTVRRSQAGADRSQQKLELVSFPNLKQKAGRISAVIGVPLIVLVLFPVIALIIAPAAIELARAF